MSTKRKPTVIALLASRSLSRKFSSRDVNVNTPTSKKQVNFPVRGYRPDDPSFQSVQVVPPGEERPTTPHQGQCPWSPSIFLLGPRALPSWSLMCALLSLADGPLKPAALRRLVLDAKGPLSKSLSMPDMDNRSKKRDRLLA